jgi:hypothetical protein
MKKISHFLSLCITFGILFVSCQSITYDELATVSKPSYSKNIQPIIAANCTSCHGENGIRSDAPYETYEQVKAGCQVQNGGILCVIDDATACGFERIMPPTGRMPQTTIDLIKQWASEGFEQ